MRNFYSSNMLTEIFQQFGNIFVKLIENNRDILGKRNVDSRRNVDVDSVILKVRQLFHPIITLLVKLDNNHPQFYINKSSFSFFKTSASVAPPRGNTGNVPPPRNWKNIVEKWCYFRRLYFWQQLFQKKIKIQFF